MAGGYNIKHNIIFGVLVYICFTFFSLTYYSGLLPMGLFVTGGLVVAGLVLFLVFRLLFVKKGISDYLLVLVVAGVLAIISDAVINRIKLKETQERANLLIDKLEDYRDQYGEYPDSLEGLVVQSLIDQIPHTAFANRQYYYEKKVLRDTISNYEYTLKYYAPLGMEAAYFSRKEEWYYDD